MYLTGFADEAARDLPGQIRATKELGWRDIESRNLNKVNLHDLDDEAFARAADLLDEAGVRINCFGSTIANWGEQITDPFEQTLEKVERAIPRMKRLKTPMVRIMSYAVLKDRGPDDQMEEERFRRVREICKRFTGEGLLPVHENCMNYGGMGWTYTLKLIENVPGLKLVYDTGNPVFTDDRSAEPPYPKQSAWTFYEKVREHVAYIHIKDGVMPSPEAERPTFTFAGEGDGDVKAIVKDALDNGYDGGISMEPHLKVVYHEEGVADKETAEAEGRYANYVEYGRRFMKLLEEIGHGDKVAACLEG